jgi:hypothetical protein
MFPPKAMLVMEETTEEGVIGFETPCSKRPMLRLINKRERELMRELKFLLDQASQYKRPPEALQQRIDYVRKQLFVDANKKYRSLLAQTN